MWEFVRSPPGKAAIFVFQGSGGESDQDHASSIRIRRLEWRVLPPVGSPCADCTRSGVESNNDKSAAFGREFEAVACAGRESDRRHREGQRFRCRSTLRKRFWPISKKRSERFRSVL